MFKWSHPGQLKRQSLVQHRLPMQIWNHQLWSISLGCLKILGISAMSPNNLWRNKTNNNNWSSPNRSLLSVKLTARPWKMVAKGSILSFWEGQFLGSMLNFRGVLGGSWRIISYSKWLGSPLSRDDPPTRAPSSPSPHIFFVYCSRPRHVHSSVFVPMRSKAMASSWRKSKGSHWQVRYIHNIYISPWN